MNSTYFSTPEKRAQLAAQKGLVDDVLAAGNAKARETARATMDVVRGAVLKKKSQI